MRIKYRYLFLFILIGIQDSFALEKFISTYEVKAHNTSDECWIIVDKSIYDITKFIDYHKDKCGEIKLSDLCGNDASKKWIAKQISKQAHKRKSVLEFERSKIGNLGTK